MGWSRAASAIGQPRPPGRAECRGADSERREHEQRGRCDGEDGRREEPREEAWARADGQRPQVGLPRRGAVGGDPDPELEERDSDDGEPGERRHPRRRRAGRARRDEEQEEDRRQQQRRHDIGGKAEELERHRPCMRDRQPHRRVLLDDERLVERQRPDLEARQRDPGTHEPFDGRTGVGDEQSKRLAVALGSLDPNVRARHESGSASARPPPSARRAGPSETTRPPSISTTRPASASASSRWWVVRSSEPPSRACALTASQTARRASRSRAAVGSSRTTSRGRPAKASATPRRRRSPPDRPPVCRRTIAPSSKRSARTSAGSGRSKCARTSSITSRTRRVGGKTTSCGATPELPSRAWSPGILAEQPRSAAIGAPQPEEQRERRRLPRPVRPEQGDDLAVTDRERDVVEGGERPEPLAHGRELGHLHGAPARRLRCSASIRRRTL